MRNLKRALSLALASVMVLGMTVVGTGASYTDVTSKQNQEAIEVLQAVGIMVGDDNGNFNPDQKVTRNEMAVVMSNLMDYRAATYAGTSPFTDVPSWAEPYVAACWNNGITSGYTKTTYGGSDTVTTSQAALMLMKALGYFQYQSDFGSDWQFATVKQANKIDLFDDVDSGVREAMTRNDLAQLVLNTLEAGTVEAEKDGQDIEVNGVTISSNVKYNYITSGKSYAYAIDATLDTATNGTQSRGAIVQLGEKLYNGDLKKTDNGDNFKRPGSAWTYKSSEIGKYADSADGEWTAKVTNKALYEAAGSDAYDSYKWAVYRNGSEVGADSATMQNNGNYTFNNHNGRDAAFGAGAKTSTERVMTTGEGVLTQVFVDSDSKTAVLSLIDTGVAKVTKVTEDSAKGEYEVTVNFKTRVPVKPVNNPDGAYTTLTPETKFTTDTKFAKDDIVVYTASQQSGEIETMAVAKTVAGKVTAQKDSDYTTVDGTKYVYNYAYTKVLADGGFGTTDNQNVKHTGLYNLEDSVANGNPAIDKDATLYLDTNGYAVAYEGKSSTAEDYLIVTGVDTRYDDVSAKVVFFDGTEKTVDIDKVNGEPAKEYVASGNGATGKPSDNNGIVKKYSVYKYTAGSSDYDLEYVADAKYGIEEQTVDNVKVGKTTIKNTTPSITLNGNGEKITTDSQTVFVDVENNKTWTGYKNVSNKQNAKVAAVLDDGVAEIVFIFGNFSSSANDDDFVIIKGTGLEATKDANKKTIYKFTGAYDVNGNQIDDLYAANPNVITNGKGLYLIKDYTDSDYVSRMDFCTSVDGLNDAGISASIYAKSAKNGVLTMSEKIDLDKDGTQDKDVFAYDGKTTFIVIEQDRTGDVDSIRVGGIDDVVSYADANTSTYTSNNQTITQSNMTGVYVITVDNDTDDTPLATSVLVIVPYIH